MQWEQRTADHRALVDQDAAVVGTVHKGPGDSVWTASVREGRSNRRIGVGTLYEAQHLVVVAVTRSLHNQLLSDSAARFGLDGEEPDAHTPVRTWPAGWRVLPGGGDNDERGKR